MKAGVAGLLLAAGSSRRFGEDKLLYPLADGTPLAVAAARSLAAVLPGSIAVVGPGSTGLERLLRASGLAVVVNPRADEGMGTSLAQGVASATDAAGWVIALADMPWIATSTVAGVAGALHDGASVVAPVYRGKRGHPVGFSARHRAGLTGLAGDSGARCLLEHHAAELVFVEVDDPGILRDVDSPADLLSEGTRSATAVVARYPVREKP